MYIQQVDSNGIWNVIADGYVYGKTRSKRTPNGKLYTSFDLCYGYNSKKKEYLYKKAFVFGEENTELVERARKERLQVFVLGTSVLIEDKEQRNAEPMFAINVTTFVPIEAFVELWRYYKSSLRYDSKMAEVVKSYEDRIATSIRYDYEDKGGEDPTF